MIPELGKYTVTVLSTYGVSVALLLLLIAVSVWRAKQVRARLNRVEERIKQDG